MKRADYHLFEIEVRAAGKSSIKMRCDAAGPCAFHEDGGPASDNCPNGCDVEGCKRPSSWVLVDAPVAGLELPAHFCGPHLFALVGGVTEQ